MRFLAAPWIRKFSFAALWKMKKKTNSGKSAKYSFASGWKSAFQSSVPAGKIKSDLRYERNVGGKSTLGQQNFGHNHVSRKILQRFTDIMPADQKLSRQAFENIINGKNTKCSNIYNSSVLRRGNLVKGVTKFFCFWDRCQLPTEKWKIYLDAGQARNVFGKPPPSWWRWWWE